MACPGVAAETLLPWPGPPRPELPRPRPPPWPAPTPLPPPPPRPAPPPPAPPPPPPPPPAPFARSGADVAINNAGRAAIARSFAILVTRCSLSSCIVLSVRPPGPGDATRLIRSPLFVRNRAATGFHTKERRALQKGQPTPEK